MAEALAAGSSAALAEVNRLTASLARTGSGLGESLGGKFYGVGLQAAKGLIQGLERQQRQLDKVADRLADRLVSQIKKRLGIKSPSRVFRDLGQATGDGLALGVRDTYAATQRAASGLSDAVVGGYQTPALDAWSSASVATSSRAELQMQTAQLQESNRLLKSVQEQLRAVQSELASAPERTGAEVGGRINGAAIAGQRGRTP